MNCCGDELQGRILDKLVLPAVQAESLAAFRALMPCLVKQENEERFVSIFEELGLDLNDFKGKRKLK